jgi:hypothetical protein
LGKNNKSLYKKWKLGQIKKQNINVDKNKYLIVNVPNGLMGDPYQDAGWLQSVRKAKEVRIVGDLPAKNGNGSYTYFDGMLEIIPQDPVPPLTEEEIQKEQQISATKQNIVDIRTRIRTASIATTDIQKGALTFDLIKEKETLEWLLNGL